MSPSHIRMTDLSCTPSQSWLRVKLPAGELPKEVDHPMKHQAAITVAPEQRPADLEALSSLAATVLKEHTSTAKLCAMCGTPWPCERVLLADHNYDLAAS